MGMEAAAQLRPKLDDLVRKAVDAAKNPADKAKAQALAGVAAQAKKPTEAFKEKIKPLVQNQWPPLHHLWLSLVCLPPQ